MDFPGGGENKSICGSADFFHDGEWANGLRSKLWSGEPERKVPGVEVDEVPRPVVIGFVYMLVIRILVFGLGIQQDFSEFLSGLTEVREKLIHFWNLFSKG